MKELQNLMNSIFEFSEKTFGHHQRNPAILHHLKEEVDELIEAMNRVHDASFDLSELGLYVRAVSKEYADCFILLLDSAHRFGYSAQDIITHVQLKIEENKHRKWGDPDENGIIRHTKE